jgi:molybdopterin biosynthesis enzyme
MDRLPSAASRREHLADKMSEQRISRLTPLHEAAAALDALAKPVAAGHAAPQDAIGQTLAADVVAAKLPPRATALQDGWAVKADDLADAGGYAPVQLATAPKWVETGDEMPAGADAVAPPDAIVMRGDVAEAVGAVTSGDGVSLPGSETHPSMPLRRAGEVIRAVDAAVFVAANISRVNVRAPRLLIVTAREDLRLLPAVQMIARDCAARGGAPMLRNGVELDDALHADDCDAIVVVGGSGAGARDNSVVSLAKWGTVAVYGVGLTPGETVAFGTVGSCPVLIVPGRLDGALASWLVLGRRLLTKLAAGAELEPARTVILSRKVTSTVGLAEIVPVRHDNTSAEPLATRNLPLSALARANGWLLVPPDSEGYPAGAIVAVNNWP